MGTRRYSDRFIEASRPSWRVSDEEPIMGEFTEKTKGAANEAIGNTKQAIGKDQLDPALKKEGEAQEEKGEFQKAKGAVEGALGNDI
jgi:uncharacterized protein YjbJ (UPF0337 family)